jgi:Raf kinase inhibitor-like YbhB/YbcL family protein
MKVPLSCMVLLVGMCLPYTVNLSIAQQSGRFTLTSSAFAPGAPIPDAYTCKASDAESPPLRWEGVPKDAKTLTLIVEDPDAPRGTFIHWVVYNIPAGVTKLDAGVPRTEQLADGGMQGVNTLGEIGYKGPCPPPGSSPHHYHFKLTALNTTLDLKPGASAAQVEAASRGHVKGETELIGIFAR